MVDSATPLRSAQNDEEFLHVTLTHKVSLFTGTVRPLPESGRPSGIFKDPVTGPVALGPEGFVGDQQADRRVHGGLDKAVHFYPAQHYQALADKFPGAAGLLIAGVLGENLSCNTLNEHDVRVGDIWGLSTVQLQVSQPRNPCWKIDERLSCPGVASYIAETGLTGWYFRVLIPGTVPPDATLHLLQTAPDALTLQQAFQLWRQHRPDLAALEQLAETPGIAQRWQEKIRQRVSQLRKMGSATRA